MAPIVVLLNRGGGTLAADPSIADKVRDAFSAVGLAAEIELIGGGDCEVRCRAIADWTSGMRTPSPIIKSRTRARHSGRASSRRPKASASTSAPCHGPNVPMKPMTVLPCRPYCSRTAEPSTSGEYTSGSTELQGYLAYDDAITDKRPGVLVVHEWWGLNDYIKQESERLSDELGVNVIALDLYDGKVATTREDASKYVQSVKTDRAMGIIHGAYDYVGANAKILTIGWCFGGGWSLQTAIEGGKQVVGCVIYYGMPEKDVDRLKKLNCDVIGFFASKDNFINPQIVDEFKQNMQKAGKNVTTYEYDADHGFANPSNPIYNKEATEDAHTKAIAFLKERIK